MKQYPKYIDSGVDWIGEIPEHWTIGRLKYYNDIIMGQSPNSEDYSVDPVSLPFLQGNAEFGELYPIPSIYCDSANKTSDENDILISVRAPVGAVNISDQVYRIGRGLAAVRKPENFKFNFFYLQMAKSYLDSLSTGSTFTAISVDDLKNLPYPKISSKEQTAIANFLDHKTRQINDLIAKKERLIELLKEERTAVINQAVTKGLDTNVPMKDSGIEWLGEIPEHWETIKLKYLAHIRYGLGQPPTTKEGGLPIIRATNIQKGEIIENDLIYADPDDLPYEKNPILKENEIIVVRSGAYTADSAIITSEYAGCVAGYDLVLSCYTVEPSLLAFALLSPYILDNQLIPLSSRAAQPHLNAEELGSTLICVPPKKEQAAISAFLLSEKERIISIIKISREEIELLQEYKTSLINEAVTGKIDVRDYHINHVTN